jgi:heterodisulfide reductase subunit A2
MNEKAPEVLIIGGGIGGICAALELAETDISVVLVEKSPAVGGILNQLDHQFPNDHCGICRMLPMVDRDAGSSFCVRRGFHHKNITVMTSTRVVSVTGNPGDFTVLLNRMDEGIDPELCTNCGNCLTVCPISIPDTFNGGLDKRKAVYHPNPARVPASPVIDWETCTKCKACVDACPENAVSLDPIAEEVILECIKGIIVATGTALADPAQFDVYGYGVLPNVVTATAFERMVSGTGPYMGKAVRPSDGKPIHRIAWIQCVGSRNVMIGADHCSTACCMFAVKEAMLAKEKIGPNTDTTIFYMDMRTFGRDFQRYRDAAEKDYGVKFIRCRIHSIDPGDQPGDVRLTYVEDSGRQVDETFDLAVLSTGQRPGKLFEEAMLDNPYGEGIEIIDSALGLKDIAATVISANRAAARVGRTIRTGPAEVKQDTAARNREEGFKQRPIIGVVLCHADKQKTPGVHWKTIETHLKALPGDLVVSHCPIKCTENNWEPIKTAVKENHVNRLILATFNPYQLWPEINALYDAAGMLPSQVEVVDLHLTAKIGATAADLTGAVEKSIEMAINRLRLRRPVSGQSVPVSRAALVIGGGPAGLSAALSLAGRGISVTLVEKFGVLGGNLKHMVDPDARTPVETLVQKVLNNSDIKVFCGAALIKKSGSPGRFHSVIRLSSGEGLSIDHGVFIIAVGGGSANAVGYEYGEHRGVITQFELEKQLADAQFTGNGAKTVVMIQCAGSREEPSNYCSRICCAKAVANAIAVKELLPDADVYIFYRDIMTYGESEKYYTRARQKGVLFIPFEVENKPLVSVFENDLVVEAMDSILGEPLRLMPDILVLSTGVIPGDMTELQSVLGFETTPDGFIKEADSKWRPVDTGREGIFVCGLARNPVKLDEAMAEGEAAAQRALRILVKTTITPQRIAARVRNAICSKCELCIDACMYGARVMDLEKDQIVVDPGSCQGCGTCAAVCPNSATVMGDFEDDGVMAAIEAAVD